MGTSTIRNGRVGIRQQCLIDWSKFGAFIARSRSKQGADKRVFGAACGVSKSVIDNAEHCERISAESMVSLCKMLDVDPREFLK